MTLRLGELFGLPAEFPSLVYDVASFRWLLVALIVGWAVLAGRSRPALVLCGGLAVAGAAVGFWVLALGRPYALFLDADVTRRAAQLSVSAATGKASEGFLSGEPAVPTLWAHLAGLGIPADVVLLLPSLLPLAGLLAVGLAIKGLWVSRERSLLAACMWLGFSTGDLDALRGVGFVSGAWGRPEAVLALVTLVVGLLGIPRFLRGARARVIVCVGLAATWALFPGTEQPQALSETILMLTLDQWPWIILAFLGVRRGLDASTLAFLGVGGLLVALGVFPWGIEPWGSHALYRLGLILAATGPLWSVSAAVGTRLLQHRTHYSLAPDRLGLAVGLLACVPGSFLAWWDPPRLDPLTRASLEPLSDNLRAAMLRIRQETAPEGVFLASSEYAPYVAVLGGRRLLLAPSLVSETADQERRLRAERMVLSGRDSGKLADLYGLRYVLVAPGDSREHEIQRPADLASRQRLRLLFAARGGFQVYEIDTRSEAPPG